MTNKAKLSLSNCHNVLQFAKRPVLVNKADPDQTIPLEAVRISLFRSTLFIIEPRCEKTGFLHMRKQRRRSASR